MRSLAPFVPRQGGYPQGVGLSEIGVADLSAFETAVRPVRSITEEEMLTSEVERVVLVYAEWYKRKSDIVAVTPEALSGAGRFC
jgi:hypothetical protein